jgi:hypothetical protein
LNVGSNIFTNHCAYANILSLKALRLDFIKGLVMPENYPSEQPTMKPEKSTEQIAAQIIRISIELRDRALNTGLEFRDTDITPTPLPEGLYMTTNFAGHSISLVESGGSTHSMGVLDSTSEARLDAKHEVKQDGDDWLVDRPRITSYPNGDLYAHSSYSVIKDKNMTPQSRDLTNAESVESAAHILGRIRGAIASTEQPSYHREKSNN